jgi:hypothetical protein
MGVSWVVMGPAAGGAGGAGEMRQYAGDAGPEA